MFIAYANTNKKWTKDSDRKNLTFVKFRLHDKQAFLSSRFSNYSSRWTKE